MKRLASVADALMRTTMWVLLPLGPMAVAIIARDGGYMRRYPASLRASVAHLRAMKRARPLARALKRNFPDAEVSEQIEGACTHCGRCCLDKACIFLRHDEAGHSRCQIYGSWFWKQLTCGEYPISGEDIGLYNCPSFTVRTARVIPIKAIPVNSERPREISQTA